MYESLELGDVFAVIAYYLAHPAEIEEYLRKCEEEAETVRRQIESSQPLDLGTDHHGYIQNQLLALEGGSLASLEEAANDR